MSARLNKAHLAPAVAVRFTNKSYTHQTRAFDTINIELKNIGHRDYFYSNTDSPTPLQIKASDFIALLTQAALNEFALETFLQDVDASPG